MAQTISLRRGYDIKLVGTPSSQNILSSPSNHCAVRPTIFRYQKLRLLVEEGTAVLAGTPLMEDKAFPGLYLCSPVSGKVQRIQRGPKRVLEAIVLEADAETRYQDFGSAKPAELDAEAIRTKMMNSGVWAHLRQRP
ncbi:MAG: NADH:ubiquinone reductase (Na(+)-transporting) subunit A, partial [Bacteroidota bacterium]